MRSGLWWNHVRPLGAIIRRNDGRRWILEARADGVKQEDINIIEREHFQSGEKLIAIISDAASAGVSLHADVRVENKRRRVHVTLQLAWSADKAVQQMGRCIAPSRTLLCTVSRSHHCFSASARRA